MCVKRTVGMKVSSSPDNDADKKIVRFLEYSLLLKLSNTTVYAESHALSKSSGKSLTNQNLT